MCAEVFLLRGACYFDTRPRVWMCLSYSYLWRWRWKDLNWFAVEGHDISNVSYYGFAFHCLMQWSCWHCHFTDNNTVWYSATRADSPSQVIITGESHNQYLITWLYLVGAQTRLPIASNKRQMTNLITSYITAMWIGCFGTIEKLNILQYSVMKTSKQRNQHVFPIMRKSLWQL